MHSPTIIVIMIVCFVIVGIGSSAAYYFARYYFRTSKDDKELFTDKPIQIGLKEPERKQRDQQRRSLEPHISTGPATAQEPRALASALSNTRSSFWGRIAKVVTGGELKPELKDELEEVLYTSDMGPQTAEILLEQVSESLTRGERAQLDTVRGALKDRLVAILNSTTRADLFSSFANGATLSEEAQLPSSVQPANPIVWMIVGVNGVGKTTTIGKLASIARARGLKTLIVAGDTFRAAADSQLKVWADRSGAEIYSPENIKDPSAMAYSGLEHGKAMKADLIIVDTAGRLHTQEHLMEELKKMKRVMAKVLPDAPQERVLVIDANAGQNALVQAREFHAAVDLTGVIVTKMDGSAKGGIVIGIASELHIPVTHIGIGESVEDLRPFSAPDFVEAIL